MDLWSMFDFLMPGYLGSAQSFRDRYEHPITKSRDTQAQARLSRRLQPFVLRRTKQEVAPELPARIETILWTELSAEQKSVYQQVLEAGRREVFNLSGKSDQGKRTMAMLTTLTRLRQVSCHLGLLPNAAEKSWQAPSAKMEALGETLAEAIDGGHRVLIFSQFVRLLKLLEIRLQAEKIAYCYLDGSTEDRAGEVARFQQNDQVPLFLISLKAGGTGLNLTGADTVMHLDPWWNPAVEEQATARAHRIGQNRIVTAYKLIARGTVEEKILELQNRKRELFAQTLFSESSLLQQLNPDEWKELLEFSG
jgi:SNF2 family DNA or RNA helicase